MPPFLLLCSVFEILLISNEHIFAGITTHPHHQTPEIRQISKCRLIQKIGYIQFVPYCIPF